MGYIKNENQDLITLFPETIHDNHITTDNPAKETETEGKSSGYIKGEERF